MQRSSSSSSSSCSSSCLKLPVFDLSKPLSPASLSSLYEACTQWGFFHVGNHGLPGDLFSKLRCLSGRIFRLPYDSKMKIGPSSPFNAYTPHFIASPFFESLRVSGPDFFASAKTPVDVLFDHGPPASEFSDILKEYGEKMTELSKKIAKAVLESLGNDLQNKFYESEFGNCHGYFRINNYTSPRRIFHQDQKQEQDQDQEQEQVLDQDQEQEQEQEQEQDRELVEGLGMHTDMSCITIVNQDEIGGLQVRSKDGEWMDINPNGETLVVNVGDLLHAWSNGRLRSSQHRVVLKRRSFVNRFSVAFFWCFDDQKVVFAPDEVVGEGNARVFRSFTCGDYTKFRESSEKGKFEKVGYTVEDFAGVGE